MLSKTKMKFKPIKINKWSQWKHKQNCSKQILNKYLYNFTTKTSILTTYHKGPMDECTTHIMLTHKIYIGLSI